MNKINNLYTTVSNGQTHIAADTRYVGSVDSYNNGVTQFFAWALGNSIEVHFDGKVRSVNKESYQNLLRNLTHDRMDDVGQYTLFRNVAENVTLASNLKMRDVISSEDRNSLFQKLAQAISNGNTSKALLMIGKGADLDKTYYERSNKHLSFYSDKEGLLSESKYTFNVFHATPILQAAKKGNKVVADFLQEAGANINLIGNEYTFKREIVDVQRNVELTYQPRFVPHHHHDRYGHHYVEHRLQYRPEFHERTRVVTQDSRENQANFKLNDNLSIVSC